MKTSAIDTPHAPAAIGPYSQAIQVEAASRLLFCSGQIPLDPSTGHMVQGSIGDEAAACLDNLRAVLGAAGLEMRHVVRCTIYLTNMGDFEEVNEAYARYFPGVPPARAAVQVSALPKGARVEIDAIAAG